MNWCYGHNKTRPNQLLRFNAEPSLAFPSGEKEKAAAVDAAKIFGGCDFGESTGSLASAGGSRSFKSITHANCSMKVKLASGEADDGGFFLFFSLGDRASERLPLPPGFKGIGAEFAADVDKGVGKDWKPKRIVSELILFLCGADESKKLRVPTTDKIAARRSKMKRSSQFKFATAAGMLEYVNEPGRLLTNLEMFNAIEDLDQILECGTFSTTPRSSTIPLVRLKARRCQAKLSASTSEPCHGGLVAHNIEYDMVSHCKMTGFRSFCSQYYASYPPRQTKRLLFQLGQVC
jgi:hypothetical protein